jgi:hypothetical protein
MDGEGYHRGVPQGWQHLVLQHKGPQAQGLAVEARGWSGNRWAGQAKESKSNTAGHPALGQLRKPPAKAKQGGSGRYQGLG